ncbi:MAG: DUF2007 domain-containing protein [Candidatus Kapaibacterium sp.]
MDLKTIATFNTSTEAYIAQDYLKVNGITSYIADDHITSMTINWAGASGYSDVKVRVEQQYAEKAAQLIQQMRDGDFKELSKNDKKSILLPKDDTVKSCPVCNSDSIEKVGYNLYLILVAVVFVNVFFFFSEYTVLVWGVGIVAVAVMVYIVNMERYSCYSCHHLWRVKREG